MSPEDVKAQSEAFLRKHRIEINPTLPIIEAQDELSPQSADTVATRAAVLSYVIGLGFGQSAEEMKRPLVDFGLFDSASPNEQRLLNASTISEQDKINCTWLVECVQSLGWCLGLVDLDPFSQCDDDLASNFPAAFVDPSEFIRNATLRPFGEIYQQADLHYRLHWAARNSRLTGQECPIQEGFIAERRKPLDWVIGVADEWDEVPMDT